jgi:hypothetical protein
MDHLSGQERKDRWYARHITPRFVTVADHHDESHTDNDVHGDNSDTIHHRQDKDYEAQSSLPNSTPKRAPAPTSTGCFSSSVTAFPAQSFLQETRIQDLALCHLQKFGFAIFSNVLDQNECHHGLQLAFDFMRAATEAERHINTSSMASTNNNNNGDSAQAIPELPVLYPRHVEGGIIPFYGAGQSSVAWYVRSKPKIKQVYTKLWQLLLELNDEPPPVEVISSLDGIVIWQNNDESSSQQKERVVDADNEDVDVDVGWFHVDQNPMEQPNFAGLQGLVNLLPTTPETGGNVLVQSSHNFFPHHYLSTDGNHGQHASPHDCNDAGLLFYSDRLEELNGDDWMEIDPKDHIVLDPEQVVCCLLRPGDLLIWDSRLVHCEGISPFRWLGIAYRYYYF